MNKMENLELPVWQHCRGGSQGGGESKATQRKERAKLSTGLGRVTGNRQNIPRSVIGASHGYRSEHSSGGLQGNFTLQKAWVILSCALHTSRSGRPFLAVEGVCVASVG